MPKGQRWYKNWQNEGFSLWLRERMEERGWNTVELAERLETKYTSGPTRWLSGKTIPSMKTLRKMAEVFNLPLDEVYKAAGHLQADNSAPRDDPRRLQIIQRVNALNLTHERYMTLSSILTHMEDATNPVERASHVDPGASPPPDEWPPTGLPGG